MSLPRILRNSCFIKYIHDIRVTLKDNIKAVLIDKMKIYVTLIFVILFLIGFFYIYLIFITKLEKEIN